MSAQTVIRDFMSALDNTTLSGTAALDQAVAAVSNFKSWSQLIETMASDCAAAGSGDTFLQNACGIILDNNDTGAITGSDAGGTVTKTADSVIPESGAWTYPASSTFTINGLTVNVPEQSTLSASAQWIVGALYTWWIGESLALIDSSFGLNFNEAGTTVKTLDVYFYNSADGKMASSFYSSGQKSTALELHINMNYYEGIDTNNPNGVGSSTALTTLDRTIAHELVHVVMSANFDWYSRLPVSFKEGAAELVHGIDDKRYSQIQTLSNDATALQSAMSGTGVNSYAAGYIALRYLAKQAAQGRDPAVSIATTDTVPATVDTVPAQVSTVVAASDTTPQVLVGDANDNYIVAGNAGATLWGGGAGNDTLVGGAGQDNFWYMGFGNDVALNVETGAAGDMLSFIGGVNGFMRVQNVLAAFLPDGGTFTAVTDDPTANNVIKYSIDGTTPAYTKIGDTYVTNDFIYEGDDIVYIGGDNLDAIHVMEAGENVNLGSGLYAKIEVIDASTSGGANALVGDAANNVLLSGGNNSALWGGAGDDIIYGGAGTDIFFFGAGEGNDVFCNVEDDDLVYFYGATLSELTLAQETDSGMLLGVGSNVLTVIGQSNTAIAFADGATLRYNRDAKTWTTA